MSAFDSYPIAGFHFSVEINGIAGVARFQEVTGLEVQVETETIKEGGRLDQEIRIPTRTKFGNITLKRGLFADRSGLADWINQVALEPRKAGSLAKHDATITLLDEYGDPVVSWTVLDAFPVKYNIAPLNSSENSIAFESIELCYSKFKLKKV